MRRDRAQLSIDASLLTRPLEQIEGRFSVRLIGSGARAARYPRLTGISVGEREPRARVDELSSQRNRIASALTVVHSDDDVREHRSSMRHGEVTGHHLFRVIEPGSESCESRDDRSPR